MERQALAETRLGTDPNKVVHETIDGEVILIHLERGNYFSLAGAGQKVWALLCSGQTPAEAAARLSDHYSVPSAEIEPSVNALVDDLLKEELIAPQNGDQPENGLPQDDLALNADPSAEFVPPKLEKYTDMQDYLLIDPIHDVSASGWPSVEPAE
jgi:hypothetical protein